MTASNLSSQQVEALTAFDTARDAFLTAFAGAPDAALAYVPPGDEYAVGTLLPHLCDTMHHYLGVLGLARDAGFARVDLAADPARAERDAQRHAELVAFRPTATERDHLLAEVAAAHQRVREAVEALDGATFLRQAPVSYSLGSEPYPTSCKDIMGWLTDHYDEHTAQVGTMLAGWRASAGGW
jgi:hypothetical protein